MKRTNVGMDPSSVPDQDLVALVSDGDSDALDQIYRRHARPVYSLVLHIVRDPTMAEDVTQEVFLKLWRQSDAYNPERGALGSWLLSVAHNRAIDLLRRRRVREEYPLPEEHAFNSMVADVADPSDAAGSAEVAASVRRALQQIPESQRQAIEMAFFQGKTHVEISEELGEPLGTAKTRIRLGMRKLRALLLADGVEI
ncbi:MAG TPA: sigma-70 family RNA polymerase sigma factor [Chloroflexota bacterium]|nr:sigma-70 family RNA polymerase sigma factor [Chloroflexota bacterium]